MALTERPYSYLIDALVPDYIKEDYPTYVDFLKRHFKAMEEESGPIAVLYSITQNIDISRVSEDKLIHFIYQYLHSFPGDSIDQVDIRQFVQNSKSFYSKKGTIESYQFIFNLLQGSLEVYFPSDDIFHINRSLLSGTHAIHDNVYYAYYVYEITTDLDEDKYSEIVDGLVHPIGTKRFHKKETFDYFLKFNYDESSQYLTLM